MSGPSPKPTNLKLIEGNKGKRKLNKQEPDPEYLEDLTAPSWLPAAAQAVWNEVAPHLAKAKLLTHVDVPALAAGCVSVAQYRQAAVLAGEDLIRAKHVQQEDGSVHSVGEHVNPWLIVQSMSFKQAMMIFSRFGMTPADRTRIAVQPQGDLFAGNGSSERFFN